MHKSFLSNLSLVVGLNILIKPLYLLGIEVSVQNRLGPEGYGLYFALLNSAYLLQIINDYGIHIFNNRLVARDSASAATLIPALTGVKLVLACLYLLLVGVAGILLGYEGFIGVLLLIAVNLSLTSFVLFFRSGISGLGLYRLDSFLSVLDKLLMILIIGGLLWFSQGHTFTIYHFVFGQMAALSITAAIALGFLLRYGKFRFDRVPVKQLRSYFHMAFPYAFIVFLMTLYTRIDGVMLYGLLENGEYEAGVYAAGYRLLDAVNMIAFLFAGLLLPMLSRAHDSLSEQRRLMDLGFRYMWMLVITVAVGAVACSRDIITFLYHEATPYWSGVFALLIVNFVAMGMMYVFGTFLTAEGRVNTLNKIYASTVVLNIVLNVVLIPKYFAAGAAVATLISQFFAAICVLAVSVNRLGLPLSLVYTGKVLLFVVICTGSGVFAHLFIADLWPAQLLFIVVGSVTGALVTGLIRTTEFQSFKT